MSLALLFSGQGTQQPGSLAWLDAQPAAATTLSQMAALTEPDWRLRLADPQWAYANRQAQVLLTGLGLAAWQCLAGHLPAPAVIAGYSVGELAAFGAAGVYDAAAALQLAAQRAQAMDDCAAAGPAGGLSAVSGLAPDRLDAIARRHGCTTAIQLGADQAVIGGPLDGLAAAENELATIGAQAKRLAVQIASHTPAMASAARRFAQVLQPLDWPAPAALLVSNWSGTVLRSVDDLKRALAAQIDHTVLWDRCQQSVAERGVRCVLEIGPGSSLSRLWNARYPALPARSIDEFHGPEGVVRWVASRLR
jgi:[acyl-carrier-protein] S-malonyltransferase